MVEQVKQLFDYCATQEEAIITYSARKMNLCNHSNVEYCNKKNTWSQAGGHFSPVEQQSIPSQQWCHINKCDNHKSGHVLSSWSGTGGIIFKCKGGQCLRQILTEMGHQQPQILIQTNNTTAEGVINNKIQPKCTKGNGHAFLLATQPRSPRSIQNLLATRADKSSGILYEASSACPPCQCERRISH